jgi:predicted HTH transcriptional regulator
MTEDNINKLMSQRHQQSLANIPSRHQKLEFSELILFYGLKKKSLNNNFAENLDFFTPNGEYNYIAYLFADNNNISVRIGKYSGKDKTDLISREDFEHCSLVTAMKKVLDRFDIENITQSTKRPMKTRLDVKLVDEASLHEVIINAFAHNDYSEGDTPIFEIFSDRFVVTSFGGLVDGLDKERFLSGVSKPRNREIMRIFKDLEFVEQLGSGIPKIIEKYDKSIFDTDGKIMQTTLYFNSEGNSFSSISKSNQKNADNQERSIESNQKTSDNQEERSIESNQKNADNQYGSTESNQKTADNQDGSIESNQKNADNQDGSIESNQKTADIVLNTIKESPDISVYELAMLCQLSTSGVKKIIKRLKKDNKIYREGPDKGGVWKISPTNTSDKS